MKFESEADEAAFWLLIFCALFAVAGCSYLTVAPKPPVASAPSVSGNKQDSGVVARLPDGGYELRPDAIANYDRLIGVGYGKAFIIPLKKDDGTKPLPDGNVEMDDEHVTDFALMLSAWRLAGKP